MGLNSPTKLLWPPVYTGYPLCPDPACGHPFGDHFDQPEGGGSVEGCPCRVEQGAVFDAMQRWTDAQMPARQPADNAQVRER